MTQAERPQSVGTAITGGKTGVLLFYRFRTGLATVGRVDTSGNYTDLRNHQFDKNWVRLFPLSNGVVAFNKGPDDPEKPNSLLLGRVQPDGTYGDLQEYLSFGFLTGVVTVTDNIALVYRAPTQVTISEVTIWRVQEDGQLMRLGIHGGFDSWTHVVSTHDGLVLFYNQASHKAATIRVQDGRYQDLKSFGFDSWSHVISTTNRILLFYNQFTGAAATGRIKDDGTFVDLCSFGLDRGWLQIVPTLDGHVFFSAVSGGPPRRASLGKIDANGAYTDGPVVNPDFDVWSVVLSVL
jgi:hypothetical protein